MDGNNQKLDVRVIASIDDDNSGLIDYPEFVAFMVKYFDNSVLLDKHLAQDEKKEVTKPKLEEKSEKELELDELEELFETFEEETEQEPEEKSTDKLKLEDHLFKDGLSK